MRRYIHAARGALADQPIHGNFNTERISFLDWATEYVDQLDPLVAKPLNPDVWPEPRSYVQPNEGDLKSLLLRLTGFDGRQHRKLTTLNEETPADDEDEEYEED